MDAFCFQPAAGAHGELTGILLTRALLESRGNPRQKILVPDSAHGTNPATAVAAGYSVENVKSNEQGYYLFPDLRAGTYKLVAESSGFRTAEKTGILLQVDQRARVDMMRA